MATRTPSKKKKAAKVTSSHRLTAVFIIGALMLCIPLLIGWMIASSSSGPEDDSGLALIALWPIFFLVMPIGFLMFLSAGLVLLKRFLLNQIGEARA